MFGQILKVNLALLKDGEIIAIMYHYPNDHPVRSKLEVLNSRPSAISGVYTNRKIFVIDSILDESEKPKPGFLVTDPSRSKEDGSLICYPVGMAVDGMFMVISIFHSRRSIFNQRFRNSYNEALKPFALRLKLEYSLLTPKELTKGAG